MRPGCVAIPPVPDPLQRKKQQFIFYSHRSFSLRPFFLVIVFISSHPPPSTLAILAMMDHKPPRADLDPCADAPLAINNLAALIHDVHNPFCQPAAGIKSSPATCHSIQRLDISKHRQHHSVSPGRGGGSTYNRERQRQYPSIPAWCNGNQRDWTGSSDPCRSCGIWRPKGTRT